MVKLDLTEVKKIELNILVAFDSFCKKNDISYRLAYGTLLGAVRHKGFIPWDDDIDVVMLREDYVRFSELMKREKVGESYEFISISNEKWREPIGKIVDKNTVAYKDNGIGVWIDIFPIDYYDEEKFKKCQQIRKIIIAKETKKIQLTKKGIGKLALKILFMPWSIETLSKKIDDIAKSAAESNTVSNMVFSPYKSDRMAKSDFLKGGKVMFEGYEFSAFEDNDSYLKKLYHDYMKLPPEKDRRTHSMNAYFLGENISDYLNCSK